MKLHRIVCLSAVLTLSPFATAQCPSGSALAQLDAILDFCVRVDPPLAPNAAAFQKLLSGGASDRELEEVLESRDFRQSYSEFELQLSKVPKSTAIAACTSTLGTPIPPKGK